MNTSPLTKLCTDRKVTTTCEHLGMGRMNETDKQPMHHWRVTLRFEGRRTTVDFWQGLGHSAEPTAADVLSSLVLDASSYENAGSFEAFVADLGYDEDSRAAERVYKACGKMAPRVRKLLGEHFDAFAGAEH